MASDDWEARQNVSKVMKSPTLLTMRRGLRRPMPVKSLSSSSQSGSLSVSSRATSRRSKSIVSTPEEQRLFENLSASLIVTTPRSAKNRLERFRQKKKMAAAETKMIHPTQQTSYQGDESSKEDSSIQRFFSTGGALALDRPGKVTPVLFSIPDLDLFARQQTLSKSFSSESDAFQTITRSSESEAFVVMATSPQNIAIKSFESDAFVDLVPRTTANTPAQEPHATEPQSQVTLLLNRIAAKAQGEDRCEDVDDDISSINQSTVGYTTGSTTNNSFMEGSRTEYDDKNEKEHKNDKKRSSSDSGNSSTVLSKISLGPSKKQSIIFLKDEDDSLQADDELSPVNFSTLVSSIEGDNEDTVSEGTKSRSTMLSILADDGDDDVLCADDEYSSVNFSSVNFSTIGSGGTGASSGSGTLKKSTLGQSTLDQSTMDQQSTNQSTYQAALDQSTLDQSTRDQSTLEQSTLEQTFGQEESVLAYSSTFITQESGRETVSARSFQANSVCRSSSDGRREMTLSAHEATLAHCASRSVDHSAVRSVPTNFEGRNTARSVENAFGLQAANGPSVEKQKEEEENDGVFQSISRSGSDVSDITTLSTAQNRGHPIPVMSYSNIFSTGSNSIWSRSENHKRDDDVFLSRAQTILDFFEARLNGDKTEIVLAPGDKAELDLKFSASTRLRFIDSLRMRCVVKSDTTAAVVQRCCRLGLDREGAQNPIFATRALGSAIITVKLPENNAKSTGNDPIENGQSKNGIASMTISPLSINSSDWEPVRRKVKAGSPTVVQPDCTAHLCGISLLVCVNNYQD